MKEIKIILKQKSFYRGIIYLGSLIFNIMLLVSVLHSLSSQFNSIQMILLTFTGFANICIFVKLLEMLEKTIKK